MIVNSIGVLNSGKLAHPAFSKKSGSDKSSGKLADATVTIPLTAYMALMSVFATSGCAKYNDFGTTTADTTSKTIVLSAAAKTGNADTTKPSANSISISDVMSLFNKENEGDSVGCEEVVNKSSDNVAVNSTIQKQIFTLIGDLGLHITKAESDSCSAHSGDIAGMSFHDGYFNLDRLLKFNEDESTNDTAIIDETVWDSATGEVKRFRYEVTSKKPKEFLVKKYNSEGNKPPSETEGWHYRTTYRYVYENGILKRYNLEQKNKEPFEYEPCTPTSLTKSHPTEVDVRFLSDICIETK